MSINISIDKNALANKICPICNSQIQVPNIKYLGLQALKLIPSQDIDYFDIDYIGGWLFYKYTGTGFPAIEVDRVMVGNLLNNQADGFMAILWLGEMSDFYLAFTEITKAQYDTYTGIDIGKDGSVYFVSQPDNINEQVATGAINAGDILLVTIMFSKSNDQLSVNLVINKYDWDNDEIIQIANKTYNTSQTYPWKTAYILEPKGQSAYFSIAMARRENRAPPGMMIRLLRKLGLENPNDVKPW